MWASQLLAQMSLACKQDQWVALSQTLCSIVGIVAFERCQYLLSNHIKAKAEAVAALATQIRPLLTYDGWNDSRALRCINWRAVPHATFQSSATPVQQQTAALALAKIILRRAGHPCTAADHFIRVATAKRIKVQRYLLSDDRAHLLSCSDMHQALQPATAARLSPRTQTRAGSLAHAIRDNSSFSAPLDSAKSARLSHVSDADTCLAADRDSSVASAPVASTRPFQRRQPAAASALQRA
jgi:hypothetical protein